jgi:hypothetical protein
MHHPGRSGAALCPLATAFEACPPACFLLEPMTPDLTLRSDVRVLPGVAGCCPELASVSAPCMGRRLRH